MSKTSCSRFAVFIWLGFAIIGVAGAKGFGQAIHAEETAGVAARKGLSITVYRSGAALVRDTRRLDLPLGAVQLKFRDVARDLLPDSVQVDSPQLTLLEQTYAANYLNSYSILQAYVGKMITVVVIRRQNGSDVEVPIQAKLLAGTPNPVLEINGKVETGLHVDHFVFPAVPPNLSSRPELFLLLENQRAGAHDFQVSYLTNGLNWAGNYVLTVDSGWKTARLSARAAVNNRSGADYSGVDVQLIAGEVRRVNEGVAGGVPSPPGMFAARAQMQAAAPLSQEPFAGYHVYTLPQPLNLPNDAVKQVALLDARRIQISRAYGVNGAVYYNQPAEPGATLRRPVELRMKFENRKSNSLGVPLPAGIARVYMEDASGREQLIGEDQLRDTAADETVTLDLGNAFDVTEEEKQTDFKRLGPRETEAAYQITLRNHQAQAITVAVNDPFSGDWQILNPSLPYTKTSATSARFDAPVPAQGEIVLKYQVRVQWGQ